VAGAEEGVETEVAVVSSPNEFLLPFIRHRMASNQSIVAFQFPIRMRSNRGGPMQRGFLKGKLLAKPESLSINGLHIVLYSVLCHRGPSTLATVSPAKLLITLSRSFLWFPFCARLHSAIPIKLSYSCLGNFPRIKTCGPLPAPPPFYHRNWANEYVQFGPGCQPSTTKTLS